MQVSRSARRTAACAILLIAACAAVIAISPNTAPARTQPAPPILLDPGSNPHALVTEAFFESGYSSREATKLATRAFRMLEGEEVEDVVIEPKAEGVVLLDPDINVHALLTHLFEQSGHPLRDAVNFATDALNGFLGLPPQNDSPQKEVADKCWVYSTVLVSCDGEQKIRSRKWVHGLCWESILLCPVQECPNKSDSSWYTFSAQCVGIEYAWVKRASSGNWVPCDWVDFGCDCFFGGTWDCDDVSAKCCDSLNAWPGCPESD